LGEENHTTLKIIHTLWYS